MKHKTRKKVVRRKRRSKAERRVMKIKRGLLKRAKKLRLGAKRTGAYVYGTLRKIVGNPASPRSLAKLMALEKDGTTRYSSAYLMSAKNAFDRGQGAELHRLILMRMRKERGRDVDMRRLAGNPRKSVYEKIVELVQKSNLSFGRDVAIRRWPAGGEEAFVVDVRYGKIFDPKTNGYTSDPRKEKEALKLIAKLEAMGKISQREFYDDRFTYTYQVYVGRKKRDISAIHNNPMEYDVLSDKYIVTGSPHRDRMKAVLTHIYAMRDAGKSQAAMKPYIKEYKRLKRIVTPLRSNPRTHGLSLKQMMKLYRMVSRGNPRAVKFAKSILGIPASESLSQVKAVVYHHVLDLKGKV